MDKDRFLESGLLQQYALGLTDEEESAEVEEYLRAYPEVRKELNDLHTALNSYAEQLDLPPRSDSKVTKIDRNENKSLLNEKNKQLPRRRRRLGILLMILLVAISGCIYFYSRSVDLSHRLETTEAEMATLKEELQADIQTQKILSEDVDFTQQEHTQQFSIDHPHSKVGKAKLFWNPIEERAMIQLLEYQANGHNGDLYLWDLSNRQRVKIAKLKKIRGQLQPLPFFDNFHQLHILGNNPKEYIVTGKPGILAQ